MNTFEKCQSAYFLVCTGLKPESLQKTFGVVKLFLRGFQRSLVKDSKKLQSNFRRHFSSRKKKKANLNSQIVAGYIFFLLSAIMLCCGDSENTESVLNAHNYIIKGCNLGAFVRFGA